MHTKHILIAAAMGWMAAAASATVAFDSRGSVAIDGVFDPVGASFDASPFVNGESGQFRAQTDGQFTLTYLGKESQVFDYLVLPQGGKLSNGMAPGASITGAYHQGELLSFIFGSSTGGSYASAEDRSRGGAGFVVLGREVATSVGSFDYVLGFSNGGQRDWDDFTVGLNAVTAVPEPEVLALMLAGLGAVGYAARRRRAD